MRNLIIYHDRCPDGSAAAWCAKHFLGEENCVFYPALHNQEPPYELAKEADNIFILDFCYGREELLFLSGMALIKDGNLLVLDHHASVEARCHGLDFCQFDMDRSGAGMAWDHFSSGQERPWFINYVEDRDIWKWEFPDAREALAYIDTMPKEFGTWDKLFRGEITLDDCVSKGRAIMER